MIRSESVTRTTETDKMYCDYCEAYIGDYLTDNAAIAWTDWDEDEKHFCCFDHFLRSLTTLTAEDDVSIEMTKETAQSLIKFLEGAYGMPDVSV